MTSQKAEAGASNEHPKTQNNTSYNKLAFFVFAFNRQMNVAESPVISKGDSV